VLGLAHAAAGAGALHFMRQLLLQPGVADDAAVVLRCVPVFLRAAAALCERWPLLAPAALGLCRQALQVRPGFADGAALRPLRCAVADALADLAGCAGADASARAFVAVNGASGGALAPDIVLRFQKRRDTYFSKEEEET